MAWAIYEYESYDGDATTTEVVVYNYGGAVHLKWNKGLTEAALNGGPDRPEPMPARFETYPDAHAFATWLLGDGCDWQVRRVLTYNFPWGYRPPTTVDEIKLDTEDR